jgi:phenylalanyl-tRNA synthetase beta chain
VFARLQGVVEDLLEVAERPAREWRPVAEDARPAWAHPVRCLEIGVAGAPLALVAALEPEVQRRLGLTGELDGEVACAAVSIDALLARPAETRRFRALPRFPDVKVDVALSVPESVGAGVAASALAEAGKGLVERCELFDLYRGPSLGAGKKSLAFHVHLVAADRTLNEQDVAKYLARVERAAIALGGELRRE